MDVTADVVGSAVAAVVGVAVLVPQAPRAAVSAMVNITDSTRRRIAITSP